MSREIGGGDDVTLVRVDSGAVVVWRSGLALLFIAGALATTALRLHAWRLSPGGGPYALLVPTALSALMLLLGLAIGRKGEGRWPLSMTVTVMREVLSRGPRSAHRWARRRRRIRLM